MMETQLIQGEFSSSEATELITQLIDVKIKYHESKIDQNLSEEDIKFREKKIKNLQKELYEIRNQLAYNSEKLRMEAIIKINTD